jgi:uncharacterized membrane-anchored protein YjiN (DUF445 family)
LKLSEYTRRKLVDAVMQSIPKQDLREELQQVYEKAARRKMPDAVRMLLNDPETVNWIAESSVYHSSVSNVNIVYPGPKVKLTAADTRKIDDIVARAKAQAAERDQTRRELTEIVNRSSTDKALIAALPYVEPFLRQVLSLPKVDTNAAALNNKLKAAGRKPGVRPVPMKKAVL